MCYYAILFNCSVLFHEELIVISVNFYVKKVFFFFKIQCELLTFCFVLFSVLYQTDVFGSKPPVICTRFCKLFDIIEQISFTDLSLVLYSFNITDIYFLIHSIKSYQFYILKPLGRNIYFRSFYQFRAGLHEMTQ